VARDSRTAHRRAATTRVRATVLAIAATCCARSTSPTAPPSPSPAARAPSAPQVVSLTWRNLTPTLAFDPPCCGDPYTVTCIVGDAEGDAIAVTIDLRAGSGSCPSADSCWTETKVYAEGAPAGLTVTKVASVPVGGSVLTCRAVDSHGFTATATSCIPTPFTNACP
jgi:hypothetical protein